MDRLPKLDNTSKNNGGLFQKKNWNTEKEKPLYSLHAKKKAGYERKDGMVWASHINTFGISPLSHQMIFC